MLIVPTDPSFLETMVRFVTTFVPTLTIHRVHIGERTKDILSLQIEMTDGSIMFVEAQYWLDRIQLVLEYGWQRVDLWMYSNFPTHTSSVTPNSPLSSSTQRSIYTEQDVDTGLKVYGINEIAMDGIFAKNIDEDLFELTRETGLIEGSFGDLLRHRDLSWVQRETILRRIAADVMEESSLVFDGNIGKDGTVKQCQLPKTCSRFEHSILGPSTVNGKLEQSL